MILEIDDRIRSTKVEGFNNTQMKLKYDSVGSTFSFDFYFDPQDQSLIDLACIGHYHIARLKDDDGTLLLTGNILSQSFKSSSTRQMAKFAGYSLPGILEDCNIPPNLYPLQSDGLTLREITNKLIAPFEFGLQVDSDVASLVDSVFDTSTANESQSIKSYLTELASQKNIILTHTVEGNLLYTRAKVDKLPIVTLDNSAGVVDMSFNFNGQAMHSDITVMKQANIDGGNAGQSTVKNPYVPFVFRPKTIIQTSGSDVDTDLAARNALNQELKNLTLVINLDRIKLDGKVVQPNQIIEVKNPEIYIFEKTKWFIESVEMKDNGKSETAKLTCVIPEIYNNQTPDYLFSGINLH